DAGVVYAGLAARAPLAGVPAGGDRDGVRAGGVRRRPARLPRPRRAAARGADPGGRPAHGGRTMSTLRARAATALACAGVFVLAACAEQTTPGGDPTPPSSPTTDPAPSPPTPLPTLPTDAPTAPPSGELPPEVDAAVADVAQRSEEHTSEIQTRANLVCCLVRG